LIALHKARHKFSCSAEGQLSACKDTHRAK